jgi:cytochrome c oxidase cbb3-type subunit 3
MSEFEQNEENALEAGVTLRDHVFDGIQEYDQKLPNWWLFTLYIMIVWFVVYWFLYYQTPWLRDAGSKFNQEIAAIEAERARQLEAMMAELDDDSLWEMSQNPEMVAAGKGLYMGKCDLCHGQDLSATNEAGQKLLGLPLTDTEWKHGGNPMDVFNIITNGAPDLSKGMIAWKAMMTPGDIAKVTAFVMSHHEKGAEWTKAPPEEGATAPPPAAAPAPTG